MKDGENYWVRDCREGVWKLCTYWTRTKDGDLFCLIADPEQIVTLPPDSHWIKPLDSSPSPRRWNE